MVPKLYAEMYVKMAKICLPKKCYNFATNADNSVKVDTAILQPETMLCKSLKFDVLTDLRNEPSKSVMVGSGRLGPRARQK